MLGGGEAERERPRRSTRYNQSVELNLLVSSYTISTICFTHNMIKGLRRVRVLYGRYVVVIVPVYLIILYSRCGLSTSTCDISIFEIIYKRITCTCISVR